jgi:hypothetical protein
MVAASVVLLIVNLVASSGIIFFEKFGSDGHRMFANKIVSYICWTATAWYHT